MISSICKAQQCPGPHVGQHWCILHIFKVLIFIFIGRVGESGKTAKELEKTIALLKKVVERTQDENERLKKTPGVLLSTGELQQLRLENEHLKRQVEDTRDQMGAKLTERYNIKEQGLSLFNYIYLLVIIF